MNKSVAPPEGSKKLHKCHICGNNFKQYDLELHFLSCNIDDEIIVKEEEIKNDFNAQEVFLKGDNTHNLLKRGKNLFASMATKINVFQNILSGGSPKGTSPG